MPTPAPASLRLGVVEPRDAIARFEARALLLPSFRWQDVWAEEHARGFAVAGLMRTDVLQAVYDELRSAIATGAAPQAFQAALRGRLAKAGFWGDVDITDPTTGETRTTRFDDRRLQLIFDVNVRQSHAAGRWDRIERTRETQPLVLYRTMQDERVRAQHAAWNGIVLPVGHPFWRTHYPPCGWRCRCTAFALSERDVARRIARGERILREPPPDVVVPYTNPYTGEVELTPRGIDPGFGYNPGQQPMAGLLAQPQRFGTWDVARFVAAAETAPMPAAQAGAAELLLPDGTSDAAAIDAFMAAVGARRDAAGRWLPRVLDDAAGEPVVLAPAMFVDRVQGEAVLPAGLAPALRLVAQTLREPDEIWLVPMRGRADTGAEARVELRRRYLARYLVGGATVAVVFELGQGGWLARVLSGAEVQAISEQRRGWLAFRREGQP